MKSYLALAATLLAASLPAQATYVDAVAGGNTTLADGSPFTPVIGSPVGTDNQWTERTFANGGTIFETNGQAGGGEDGPMLKTTVSGLIPGIGYVIYGYFWSSSDNGAVWRGRALVSNTQPSPEIPGYNTRHFSTSSFAPMRPLADDSPLGTSGYGSLQLTRDANGFESSGHFTNQVLLQEGNRWLYQAFLGVHTANGNGEIDVYIDDLANTSNANRTWYDGVGYELAPFNFGLGCGSPAAPRDRLHRRARHQRRLRADADGRQRQRRCLAADRHEQHALERSSAALRPRADRLPERMLAQRVDRSLGPGADGRDRQRHDPAAAGRRLRRDPLLAVDRDRPGCVLRSERRTPDQRPPLIEGRSTGPTRAGTGALRTPRCTRR